MKHSLYIKVHRVVLGNLYDHGNPSYINGYSFNPNSSRRDLLFGSRYGLSPKLTARWPVLGPSPW